MSGGLRRLRARGRPGKDGGGNVARLLRQADALAEGGQAPEAIRLLTEARAEHPAPALDRRLIELRFEGFTEPTAPTDATEQRPAPTAVVDDLFPGQQVPEIGYA